MLKSSMASFPKVPPFLLSSVTLTLGRARLRHQLGS